MAKIAVLLPKEFMLEQAEKVISKGNYNIHYLKVINTVDAISEARNAVNEGADIIVSRGYQAKLIQENTNIVVAEIKVSTQDIAYLIKKSKQLINKKNPKIAIVAFKNMIENISYLSELFDVSIFEYYIDDFEEMDYVIEEISKNSIDIVLGGETVIQITEKYNIPSLFLSSTEDSIEKAFILAKRMAHAIDIEQSNQAYVNTVMETSFNGIIKIDKERRITAINRAVESILEKKNTDVSGTAIEKLMPEINVEYINDILNGKKEKYSTSIRVNGFSVMLVIAPIQFEGNVYGAIISSRKLDTEKADSETIKDMIMNGFTAKYKFSAINTDNKIYMENIELAKKYAIIKSPVFIVSRDSIEAEKIAQAIHNNSNRKNAPYISINCSGMNNEEQKLLLFGNTAANNDKVAERGVVEVCNLGTLYISEIDKLSLICQYKLFKIINCLPVFKPDVEEAKKYDIKVIVSASKELWSMVKEGTFREDLYYCFCPFIVKIPSLKNRTADIKRILRERLKTFTEKYFTYMTITDEAISAITSYNWEGNEIQFNFFCDRLFLTSSKRVIDEDIVKSLIEELYPNIETVENEERLVIYRYPEAEQIIKMLDKYRGNRAAVANELNISTTTLWRKMKKYGILSKYKN